PAEQAPPQPSQSSQKPPTKAPRPARAKPGPPAQASQVVARQPDGPVDMTNNVFVTGNAKTYAGGVSSANGTAKGKGTGTGTGTGPSQDAGTPKAPAPRPGPDRTMSVHLESSNWECPWPVAAIDEPIDEQLAVIRVTVAKNGSVVAAKVLQDPGHGFGAAALKCAKQTRFEPATNRAGQPIRAQSPPIRVWFSR
ncbi:MAG: energy transducer TonB, partial [Nannocystaceae bacterium]